MGSLEIVTLWHSGPSSGMEPMSARTMPRNTTAMMTHTTAGVGKSVSLLIFLPINDSGDVMMRQQELAPLVGLHPVHLGTDLNDGERLNVHVATGVPPTIHSTACFE